MSFCQAIFLFQWLLITSECFLTLENTVRLQPCLWLMWQWQSEQNWIWLIIWRWICYGKEGHWTLGLLIIFFLFTFFTEMSDLKICRICLVKDLKLYHLKQFSLNRYYEEIADNKVNKTLFFHRSDRLLFPYFRLHSYCIV